MLLFSTTLEISDTLTKDEFIQLVIRWNQETPHHENRIPCMEWNGERNIRFGDDLLWLDISEYRNGNIIAIRYEKTEKDGVVWATDYILNFNEMKMSITLDRSYKADAPIGRSYFSAPYFITMLIQGGYLKSDGELPVSRCPIYVDNNNLSLLADVINGNMKYRLPIVYVSKTAHNENPLNVNLLADKLKGVAHILVEEDVELNAQCRELCQSNNEYYGAVGIYFPNNAYQHIRYLYHRETGYDYTLFDKVMQSVLKYGNFRNRHRLYTWHGVNNAILTDKLRSQREERLKAEQAQKKAEDETAQIYDEFGGEVESLERRVKELTRELESLRWENNGLREKLETEAELRPVIHFGEEDELYSGEIQDIVLEILSDALRNVRKQTRREDVLKDILQANEFKQLSKKRRQQLKQLLTGYTNMTRSIQQGLKEIGLEVGGNGKHHKLTYCNDCRYSTSLAKTPSEGRGNLNSASDIANYFF